MVVFENVHCCYEGVREQYENVVLAIESNKRTPSINTVDTPCFELDRPGWNAWSGRNFWFSIGQVSRTMLGVLVELPTSVGLVMHVLLVS